MPCSGSPQMAPPSLLLHILPLNTTGTLDFSASRCLFSYYVPALVTPSPNPQPTWKPVLSSNICVWVYNSYLSMVQLYMLNLYWVPYIRNLYGTMLLLRLTPFCGFSFQAEPPWHLAVARTHPAHLSPVVRQLLEPAQLLPPSWFSFIYSFRWDCFSSHVLKHWVSHSKIK